MTTIKQKAPAMTTPTETPTTAEEWIEACLAATRPELADATTALATAKAHVTAFNVSAAKPSGEEMNALVGQIAEAWTAGETGHDIRDAFDHPWFRDDGRRGAFLNRAAFQAEDQIARRVNALRAPRDEDLHWFTDTANAFLQEVRSTGNSPTADETSSFTALVDAARKVSDQLDRIARPHSNGPADRWSHGIAWLDQPMQRGRMYKQVIANPDLASDREPWTSIGPARWLLGHEDAQVCFRTPAEAHQVESEIHATIDAARPVRRAPRRWAL